MTAARPSIAILSERIPQLTIVLASRVRPSLHTGRLRVSGEMIEVRVEEKLKIDLNTVKTRSKSIFSKLGVRSRTQAAIKSLDDDRQMN
ncbi:LuxR C-terminal-related transcriptional regulator [Labrys monachus]|uniref:ATP/maltotriose-dependent transcriptional regulator MalT n=1 Tax=Labrys monachus TaxID=217067 RepID=A0ABU0F8J0_9HYPH|nr:LuxR C-terminal-related transcriptional regulator [Labrys monachus]MDQ0390919.1 ATP/maltotriose-dependent transcriptional regulator MalT [Labrys monachus]